MVSLSHLDKENEEMFSEDIFTKALKSESKFENYM